MKEVNFVHELENWRQLVRRETQSAKNFQESWGFLVPPPKASADKHSSTAAKYVNPRGGGWTVARKLIPVHNTELPETQDTATASTLNKKTLHGCLSANDSIALAHSNRMEWVHTHNPAFRTTYEKFGQRNSLEQFGVRQYGPRVLSVVQQPAP